MGPKTLIFSSSDARWGSDLLAAVWYALSRFGKGSRVGILLINSH